MENIDAESILQTCRLCFRVKKTWLLNAVLLDIWRFDIIEKHFININNTALLLMFTSLLTFESGTDGVPECLWIQPPLHRGVWLAVKLYKELKSVISRTAALFIVLTLKRISRFESSVLLGASNWFLEKLFSGYESYKIILKPMCFRQLVKSSDCDYLKDVLYEQDKCDPGAKKQS